MSTPRIEAKLLTSCCTLAITVGVRAVQIGVFVTVAKYLIDYTAGVFA